MSSPRLIVVRSLGVLAVAALLLASCGKGPSSESRAQNDPVPRAPDDPVVVRVNGVDIGESDIAFAEEEVGGTMPAMAPEQKREYLITYLTDVVILAQAAEKQKLGDSPDVKRQIMFEHNKVLMESLLKSAAKSAQTEPEMHKVYDEAVKEMGAEQEVHARHILVDTEEEAKAIEAELKAGADFAEEAKKKSRDPGAANGGDLGYFTKDQMVPEFSEVAFKLDKGQISDPIHTQFGWHIIKVEDKRAKPTPPFEEVKKQVASYIAHRAQAQLVENLRKTATIDRLDQPKAPSPMLNPGAPLKK
jgi:peptidyl-prolyl cis-trans isomerase C